MEFTIDLVNTGTNKGFGRTVHTVEYYVETTTNGIKNRYTLEGEFKPLDGELSASMQFTKVICHTNNEETLAGEHLLDNICGDYYTVETVLEKEHA